MSARRAGLPPETLAAGAGDEPWATDPDARPALFVEDRRPAAWTRAASGGDAGDARADRLLRVLIAQTLAALPGGVLPLRQLPGHLCTCAAPKILAPRLLLAALLALRDEHGLLAMTADGSGVLLSWERDLLAAALPVLEAASGFSHSHAGHVGRALEGAADALARTEAAALAALDSRPGFGSVDKYRS
jgi:hypothetical protein